MNKFKYILMLVVVACVFAFCTALAANPKVQLNGNTLDFTDEQGNKVEAQLINNRTMVPLRKIFESLDCTIDWNQETKTVTAKSNNKTIKLTIGSNNAYVINNSVEEKIILDSAPVIVDNRTLVPLRFIAESLGCDVGWDQKNQTAIIIDYEEIAKIIESKSKYIYWYANGADEVSITRKYSDEWDSSRNETLTLKVIGTEAHNPDGLKAEVKFDGNAALVNEIKNEEWNDFAYYIYDKNDGTYFQSDNYVFSSMFGAKKGTEFKLNTNKYDLSNEKANNLKQWIQLVTNVDTATMDINTYKTIKSDWQKFANTFLGGSKSLKANDFAYTYISLDKLASTRTSCIGINTILLLNKMAFKLNLDYQDLLSDYPTITYSFSEPDANQIKIVVTLKSGYKETVQYEFSMLTWNVKA